MHVASCLNPIPCSNPPPSLGRVPSPWFAIVIPTPTHPPGYRHQRTLQFLVHLEKLLIGVVPFRRITSGSSFFLLLLSFSVSSPPWKLFLLLLLNRFSFIQTAPQTCRHLVNQNQRCWTATRRWPPRVHTTAAETTYRMLPCRTCMRKPSWRSSPCYSSTWHSW